MPLLPGHCDSGELVDRLRDADAPTAQLVSDLVSEACWRFPPVRGTEKTVRIERLIKSGAWTDAALALIELELPDWLDSCIETRHADRALAILSAFVGAQCADLPPTRTSVPSVPRAASPFCEPVCCENFS